MELDGSHRAPRPVDPLLNLRHEWVDQGSCTVRSQLLGSMPSEGPVHVRSIERIPARSGLRMVHMPGMTAPASSVPVRLSPTRQVPDLEGCTRHSCGEPRSPPGASCDVTRTMPRPRLCRAAVVLLLGLARPARRPTRRPCLGHVVSSPALPPPPRQVTPLTGREPQSGPRHVVRQQRPDPAHRDGHQPPVLGPQYPHPPDSGTHLHRDHPAGRRNDPRRTSNWSTTCAEVASANVTAVASGCARPPTSAPALAVLHGLPLRPSVRIARFALTTPRARQRPSPRI